MPQAETAARTNLPARLRQLIGRDEELAAVKERLLAPDAGLVTLTGAGGSGKTSLALRVARDLLSDFADGVWLVELAPLSDPTLVPQAVATALGVRDASDRPLLETLLAYLRDTRLLLVLDNAEHLIDASAQLAEALLGACPELHLLVTSREPLRVTGEVNWRVPSLDIPDPEHVPPLEALSAIPAVRLFVERARAAQPRFALTTHNASAVAQVCAQLDGIPLALELAAARVATFPIDTLAERLGDSFKLLGGGNRGAPSRQQTLRATLDWSWDLLTQPEQALLRRLAVFAGGWDPEAAEAVGAGDGIEQAEVLELLGRLVDKSLALLEEHDGVARYRLLEPLRQYARERLEASGHAEATRHQHAKHYLVLAERVEPELRGPNLQKWLQRLEREHDNFRAALDWSFTAGYPLETGQRITAALGWFWVIHSHFSEGRRWLLRTVEATHGVESRARAHTLNIAGLSEALHGEYASALPLAEESRALSERIGDRANLAFAMCHLAFIMEHQGNAAEAEVHATEALQLSRALDDRWLTAHALQRLGEAARLKGDFRRAAGLFQESLDLARSTGDPYSLANSLNSLGHVLLALGEEERARSALLESLELARELGFKRRSAMCLEGLAAVASLAGRPARAARLFAAADALWTVIGASREQVYREAFASHIAEAKARLGEEGFASAWTAGRKLSLEQAIAEALTDAAQAPGTGG